jgi:hypothetical protein
MKLYLAKTDNGSFIPAYNSDKELADKIKPGRVVEVSLDVSRNYKFLKKYWALVKFTLFYLPEELAKKYKTKEQLHREIKIQCGIYERVESLGGKQLIAVGSISFEKMTPEQYAEFFSQAIDVVCKYLLPGTYRKDIEAGLLEFM